MKNITMRIGCFVMMVLFFCQNVAYSVCAGEEVKIRDYDMSKDDYTYKERKNILKKALKKIDNGEELTMEEEKIIGWEYEDLQITLPEQGVEWEVDHEKGIGVNGGIMTLSTTVEDSLICNKYKTIVEKVGTLPAKDYSNGKGGNYIFNKKVISSFLIPGLNQTTVGNGNCNSMVIQGICSYYGYIFMTAYCGSDKHNGHNAVIYVLDVPTKSYITTLLTGEEIHAGGIAYANGYLWIGHTGSEDTGYLYYYNISQIEEAISYVKNDDTITAVDISNYDKGCVKLFAGNKASYLTTYNGYLCVGEYMEDVDDVGEIALYNPSILLKGIVNRMKIATVPGNANGALFCSQFNKTYLMINSNEGVKEKSKAYIYSVSGSTLSPTMTYKKTIELPCMVEEAYNAGDATYFVFESAAEKYRGTTGIESIVGSVCGLSSVFVYK